MTMDNGQLGKGKHYASLIDHRPPSTVPCPLSTVPCPLIHRLKDISLAHCLLSPLSIVHCPLSIVIVHCPLIKGVCDVTY